MDVGKLTMLMNGFNSLAKNFEEPLLMAFGAMIAFAVMYGMKRLVLE